MGIQLNGSLWSTPDQSKNGKTEQSLAKAQEDTRKAINNLGMKYFEDHQNDATAEYKAQIEEIKKLVELESLWEQYKLSLEGKIKCERCGATITSDSAFCNKCGKPIPKLDFSVLNISEPVKESEPSSAPEANVCPSCGSPLVEGAMFCEKCGKRL